MRFPKLKRKKKPPKGAAIDDDYLVWLSMQPCVITQQRGNRGVGINDMHIHHVRGRKPRNDYEAVPMIGYVHSWGSRSLHNMTRSEFIREYNLPTIDLKEYLLGKARELRQQYLEEI